LIISVPESIRADSSQPAGALSSIEQNNFSAQPLSKSHAPEPPTLLLFISGVTAMIIRFARKSFRAFKRVLDPVLALTAIAICSPLFIVIAFLVRITSEGPVIYLQERVGKRGKSFMMFKFRTMSVDAEKGIGAVWAKQNDPRVTQVGGILRTTHFDELPQLLNVLKGEMSIVGPRPERPQIVKDLRKSIVDYDKRLAVLPGITGLSQVLHRADESINDVRKKVKYDLLYIKKMCWLMELRVMTSTVFVMLSGKSVRFN
jgi:lipopolysaccharide/colanic/teichoic acid biosynthesis glycosyltransferase